MKTTRVFTLTCLLLVVACSGLAAYLDRWFMCWQGNRSKDFNPLRVAIGEGQKLFAGKVYRKADVYFHSGMYPTMFDDNKAFRTAHMAEDSGTTGTKNSGDENAYLGQPLDIIDSFSRHFFPSRHTHLDEGGPTGDLGDGGQVREILPWLKLAQEMDPEEPLTYTVTAYWLRNRMKKAHEAELFLREGLRNLPDHPVLLFELGRIYLENNHDPERARNIWQHAAEVCKRQNPESDTDKFIYEQILSYLAVLEEKSGNIQLAITYWEQAKTVATKPGPIQDRIDELRKKH